MLIFLDIDGVMVPARGWQSPELLDDGFPAFSQRASHALNQMISMDDVVILTTSHKSRFSIQEWKNIFNKRGIVINTLESLPENSSNLSRKDEILQWFSTHSVNEKFIIIDDDRSLNDLPSNLKKCLIQPSPFIGLV